MAIDTNIVEVSEETESGKRVRRVIEGSGSDPVNAAGSPTVVAYLLLEAQQDFVPVLITDYLVITMSATNINAA